MGLAAALTRLGPSWVKLGQFLATRPMSSASGRTRPRDAAGPDGALSAGRRRRARSSARSAAARSTSSSSFASRSPRPRSRRSTRRTVRDDGRAARSRSRSCGPASRGASARDLSTFYFAARAIERLDPGPSGCGPSRWSTPWPAPSPSRWICGWRPRPFRKWPRISRGRSRFPRAAPDWNRTARNVLTLEWIDGVPLSDLAALAAAGHDLRRSAATSSSPSCATPSATASSMPTCIQGNLFVDAAGNLVAVDFGIMGRPGLKERRFLAEILHGFITPRLSARRRGAFRGRLCAAPPFGRRFRPGDPRHRRADPPEARRRDLDGASS